MRHLTVAALVALSLAPSSVAASKTIAEQLTMLTPEARVEQRCNGRLSGLVRREHREFKPDEVVAYAFGDTLVRGRDVTATGAAFRSRGSWYRASYRCRATPDGLEIEKFEYTLGPKVPRQEWDAHYLVP